MKTSNKILTIVAAAVIVLGLGLIIGIRVILHNVEQETGFIQSKPSFSAGDWIEKEYEYGDFKQVEFTGGWKAELESGEEYRIAVRLPEELEDVLEVKKKGGTLMVGTDGIYDMDGKHFEVKITMPELEAVEVTGGIDARLSGFTGSTFLIEGSGGLNVVAKDCRYDDLRFETSGGANAELRDMPVRNAHIESAGALNMVLTMEGGELSGRISGVCSLDYYGEVSNNTLSVSGVSSISHK